MAECASLAKAREKPHDNALSLAALCLGFFMVMIDVTVVNVALPNLSKEFHTGVSGLQWTMDGYTLTFASMLITAGDLGDRIGPKRVFQVGLAMFVIASAACGIVSSLWMLIIMRLLQGASATLVVPTSLALINASFPDRRARARAIGVWASVAGLASAAGPPLGGLLTEVFNWRAVFFVNVPIGLIALALTGRYVISLSGNMGRQADLRAQCAGIVSLSALAFALIEAGSLGWAEPAVVGAAAVFIAALWVFIAIERRAADPMLPLNLFQSRTFTVAILVGMAINIGFYGQLFLLPLYFEQLRGYTALLTGAAILPQVVMAAIVAYLGGWMTSRVGARLAMIVGLLVGGAGFFAMLIAEKDGPAYGLLVPALFAIGFGTAFTMPAATAAVLEAVPKDRAGLASGALNSSRQVGSLIGVAAFGSLVSNQTNFVFGMHIAFALGGVVFLAACAFTLLFMKHGDHDNG
jgi:MFS transporter, DHA2 family, methylenomycin A resistance protein